MTWEVKFHGKDDLDQRSPLDLTSLDENNRRKTWAEDRETTQGRRTDAAQLAEKVDVQPEISRIETGSRTASLELIANVSVALELELHELFRLHNRMRWTPRIAQSSDSCGSQRVSRPPRSNSSWTLALPYLGTLDVYSRETGRFQHFSRGPRI